MKRRRSSFIVLLSSFVLLCALCAKASGIASLHSLETGSVSIMNNQSRSAWHPVAVLFRFDVPVTGTLTITRQTEGESFELATCELADNQHAVWIPDAPITFNLGDALVISSTAMNGSVEIIRKGE
jgi:hypothetical protein